MSDLSKNLEDELAEFLYGGIAEFSGIENGNFPLARKILALPSLRETIEKAEAYDEEKALYESEKQLYKEAQADAKKSKEKYDKLFEGLRAEGKCGCTVTVTSAKAFCSLCNGTGKVLREWTEDEKGEEMKILEAISKDVDNMNDKAVRKWLKRCQMAIFLIKGKLHQTGFNPESVSGQPQEMIDKLRTRLEALSEFSTEIAKIIKKYKVAYTGDILNKANSAEDNRKAWEEYFSDRRRK